MELFPDRMASLVSSIGHEQFGKAILGMFDPELEITHCVAYDRRSTRSSARMLAAHSASDAQEAVTKQLARHWMSNDYCCDPWVREVEQWASDAPDVLYLNVPASSGSGERARIVQQYYDKQDVGEEAVYAVRTADRFINLTLYKRRGSASFTTGQRADLGRLAGFILKTTERHADLLPSSSEPSAMEAAQAGATPWNRSRADRFNQLRSALLRDANQLTLRETEICAYIVLGYTVFAIGLLLGISPNTVATHRKRAYSKLGLTSQTELFNVCLKYLV